MLDKAAALTLLERLRLKLGELEQPGVAHNAVVDFRASRSS